MACILKRTRDNGNVSYFVQVRLKGQKPVSATFDKEKDARIWATLTEAAIREGRRPAEEEVKVVRRTLKELLERYQTDILPQKKGSEIKQKAQLQWFRRHLGNLYLDQLTPAHLSDAKNKLSRERISRGTLRSNATVNRYLAVLSHVFTIAVREWNWMESNPMRKVTRLREPRGRTRFLSDTERSRLFSICRGCTYSPALYPIVVTATYTGMRFGEIVGLLWQDVDFERQRLIVQHSKNGEKRQVPLPPPVMQVLQEWAQKREARAGRVFPSRRNPTKPLCCRTAWLNSLDAAGLKDFHFHDLRHTAASYLAMSGASLQEIAEVLGHKTLMMVKRYAHLTLAHTSEVVRRMTDKFAPSMPELEEGPLRQSRRAPASAKGRQETGASPKKKAETARAATGRGRLPRGNDTRGSGRKGAKKQETGKAAVTAEKNAVKVTATKANATTQKRQKSAPESPEKARSLTTVIRRRRG